MTSSSGLAAQALSTVLASLNHLPVSLRRWTRYQEMPGKQELLPNPRPKATAQGRAAGTKAVPRLERGQVWGTQQQ